MVKSLISYALVGVTTYLWYWAGYVWPYLSGVPMVVYLLFTVLVILIHRRGGVAAVGANVGATMINRVQTIVGSLLGLLVVVLVGGTLDMLVNNAFDVNNYLIDVVLVLCVALTTSLFVGALDDATQ